MKTAAFVLAAGRGERMSPLTPQIPKPLLPVGGKPMLWWTLRAITEAGIEEVFINATTGVDRIREVSREASTIFGCDVTVIDEGAEPIGTGTALKAIAGRADRVLVHNCDVLTDMPLSRMIEAHELAKSQATLMVLPTEDSADVVVDQGWVVDLVDRREETRWGPMYAGICVLASETLEAIPSSPTGLYESAFSSLVSDRAPIAAVEWAGYHRGIDRPEDLLRSNLDVVGGAVDLGVTVEPGRCVIGDQAAVEGSLLRDCVIGDRAIIETGSDLIRCVVLNDTKVPIGTSTDTIFLPGGDRHVALAAP